MMMEMENKEEEESSQSKVVVEVEEATTGGDVGGGGTGLTSGASSSSSMMMMDSYTPVHQSSHPLLNDAILSNLIEACGDASQLAQLRTVCKTWEERSRSRWRRIATVTHDVTQEARAGYSTRQHVVKVVVAKKKCNNKYKKTTPAPFDESDSDSDDDDDDEVHVVPAMECDSGVVEKYDLSSTPFRQFRLVKWDIKAAAQMVGGQSFWNQVGSWMTTLTLSKCAFYDSSGTALRRLLFQKTPNLETLTLDNVDLRRTFSFSFASGFEPFRSLNDGSELDIFRLDEEGRPQRQQLNLKSISICGNESLFNMIFCLLGPKLDVMFPNLQKIRLSVTPAPPVQPHRLIRIHSSVTPRPPPLHPFMQLLELHEQSQFGADDYDTLSQLLIGAGRVREHDPTKFQITHLDILGLGLKYGNVQQFPEKVGVLLQERSFPLKSLSVDVGVVSVSNEAVLEGILKCHSSTLTKLELRRSQLKLNPVIRFPFGVTLSCLVELKLHGAFLTSIADFQHFPNLRTFECRPRQGEEQPLVTMDAAEDNHLIANFRLPRLLAFKFTLFEPGTPANLRVLAECMPNLEEIWMQINSDTFPALCSLWQNSLRKLNVSYWRNAAIDDSVITGLNYNKGARVGASTSSSSSSVSFGERKPNITNLIHLQEFGMHPNPPKVQVSSERQQDSSFSKEIGRSRRLTHLSFEEGFCLLANLKKLRVVMNEKVSSSQQLSSLVTSLRRGKGVDVRVYPGEKCECEEEQEMCSSWIPICP